MVKLGFLYTEVITLITFAVVVIMVIDHHDHPGVVGEHRDQVVIG